MGVCGIQISYVLFVGWFGIMGFGFWAWWFSVVLPVWKSIKEIGVRAVHLGVGNDQMGYYETPSREHHPDIRKREETSPSGVERRICGSLLELREYGQAEGKKKVQISITPSAFSL